MLEPLLEELKLVIEQKIEFENLELLFDTTFWNFRQTNLSAIITSVDVKNRLLLLQSNFNLKVDRIKVI